MQRRQTARALDCSARASDPLSRPRSTAHSSRAAPSPQLLRPRLARASPARTCERELLRLVVVEPSCSRLKCAHQHASLITSEHALRLTDLNSLSEVISSSSDQSLR